MAGKVELLTPSNGKVALVGEDTATDVTVTVPAGTGDLFSQANILGTVSQSSGVPTGAIIERGSNANGEYVKYADGTMICFLSLFTLEAANGSEAQSTRTYPATFFANPMVFGQSLGGTFDGWSSRFVFGTKTRNTTSCSAEVWNSIGGDSTQTIQIMVIGKWF